MVGFLAGRLVVTPMLKVYEEDPEFDHFTLFDTDSGRLSSLSSDQFQALVDNAIGEPKRLSQDDSSARSMIFRGPTASTHTRFPRRIYFQITRRCSLTCPYCFIKAEKSSPHVPTHAITNLARIMGEHGLMEVRLTGGEPTEHPDFFSIMHAFRDEGVYVSVATNGMWNRRTLAGLCREPSLWVICSIDGGREVHNRFRPGTFDKIITNLRCLREHNPSARIRVTTVLTRHNNKQMFELGKIALSLGAESITVIPLRPQVRNPEVVNDMVTAAEFRQVIEDLIAVKDRLGIPFTTTMETHYKSIIYRDPIVRKHSSCAAGREALNLDYNAATQKFQVYACSYSPASDLTASSTVRAPFLAGEFALDNLSALAAIWQDESAWTLYRDLSIRSRTCQDCTFLKHHQCTGSCPIQNIDYSAINADRDVLAQLREQIVRTGEWYCYQHILGSDETGGTSDGRS